MRERATTRRAERAGLQHAEYRLGRDTIALWHGGRGRPLLLLHGFGAAALWQWDAQLHALASDHALVVPDLLGFGGSSGPGDDPSIDHQVAAMIALLDALELDEVDVVGVSYGGLVGYALAGQHPTRVRRLVLVDSPGHVWSTPAHRAMLRRFAVDSAAELLVPRTPDGIRTLVGIASHRRHWIPDPVARQVLHSLYDPRRADQIALLEHLELDVDGSAATIRRPRQRALVVWGACDPVFPIDVGRRLAHDLGAPMFVLPRARHLPNAEFPRRFNAALESFLSQP